jgi:Fe-S-cluster-containing hydrogenase component 2
VIGAALPSATGNTCTGCNVCTGVCREGAISPRFGFPVIDYSRCVSCGECARACPCGSIEIHSTVSGCGGRKLGRHRVARELGSCTPRKRRRSFRALRPPHSGALSRGQRFAELLDR